MNIVNPQDRTTLLLNVFHEPFGVCTARAAFRHLMTGRVMGIDATDVMYSWDGSNPDEVDKARKDPTFRKSPASTVNWSSRNIQVYEDQPVLRSTPDFGVERTWYVPTVVRCNKHFGYRAKGNRDIPLRKVYDIYKKTCQYCFEKIPYTEATKDHVYPKSRGGSNHDFNIVLACRRCNNDKDSHYPYFNKDGKEVKPLKTLPSGMFLPGIVRPEWKKYLFLE